MSKMNHIKESMKLENSKEKIAQTIIKLKRNSFNVYKYKDRVNNMINYILDEI